MLLLVSTSIGFLGSQGSHRFSGELWLPRGWGACTRDMWTLSPLASRPSSQGGLKERQDL